MSATNKHRGPTKKNTGEIEVSDGTPLTTYQLKCEKIHCHSMNQQIGQLEIVTGENHLPTVGFVYEMQAQKHK